MSSRPLLAPESDAPGGPGPSAPSIDPAEIERFSRMADEWWDPSGKFRPLHKFNPTRIAYIRDRVVAHFGRDPAALRPFEGLRLLDIGCGGGLLCEPMTRLGASVVGADASEKNIRIASLHAAQSGLAIDYRNTSAEALAEAGERFDIVLNMEVVEHVADIESFIGASGRMLKPGGMMVVATLNRTAKAFALAILGAEYVLRWLPRGTHDWRKFVRPSELDRALRGAGLKTKELTGVSFNPIADRWSLSRDLDVNYMALATRPD